MFRLTFRFLGFLLLAGAFAALVVDGTRSIAGNRLSLASFSQTMLWLMPDKFAALRRTLQHAHPHFLWDPVMAHVLLMPTWLILGAIGILLLLLTQKPQPGIGYSER